MRGNHGKTFYLFFAQKIQDVLVIDQRDQMLRQLENDLRRNIEEIQELMQRNRNLQAARDANDRANQRRELEERIAAARAVNRQLRGDIERIQLEIGIEELEQQKQANNIAINQAINHRDNLRSQLNNFNAFPG